MTRASSTIRDPRSTRHDGRRTSRLHVVVTAGPTWEPLDPVRYVTNRSTGAMGYAVAAAAQRRRHRVTLISGPSGLTAPRGVRLVRVTTACEMRDATLRALARADALVMTAAVADYRPATFHRTKLKRAGQRRTVQLIENPDILAEAGRRFGDQKLLVGFALESRQVVAHAREKFAAKRLDLIIGNTVRGTEVSFGRQPLTDVQLLTRRGVIAHRRRASKPWVAQQILDFLERCTCCCIL